MNENKKNYPIINLKEKYINSVYFISNGLKKSNTSISEEINNETFTVELNKKKEEILGIVTTPKISKSTLFGEN